MNRNFLLAGAVALLSLSAAPALAQNCQLGSVGCTVQNGPSAEANPVVAPVTTQAPVNTVAPITTVAPVTTDVTTVAPVIAPVVAPVITPVTTSGVVGSGNAAQQQGQAIVGSGNSSVTGSGNSASIAAGGSSDQTQGQQQANVGFNNGQSQSLSGNNSGASSTTGDQVTTVGGQQATLTGGDNTATLNGGDQSNSMSVGDTNVTTGPTSLSTGDTTLTGGNQQLTDNDTQANAQTATNTVTVEGDHYEAAKPAVNTAYAAPLSIGGGVCAYTPLSAGVSLRVFSGSVSGAVIDQGCERRANADVLARLGYQEQAVALLMQNPDVAAAFATVTMRPAASVARPAPVASAETAAKPASARMPLEGKVDPVRGYLILGEEAR